MDNEQILNTIKFYSEKSKLTIRQLCVNIEMTESGFYRAIERKSLKYRDIESIASVLNVQAGVFFDSKEDMVREPLKDYTNSIGVNIKGNRNRAEKISVDVAENKMLKKENEGLAKEIALLRELLAGKDETIQALKGR